MQITVQTLRSKTEVLKKDCIRKYIPANALLPDETYEKADYHEQAFKDIDGYIVRDIPITHWNSKVFLCGTQIEHQPLSEFIR